MITIIKSAEIYKDLQVLKSKWFQDQPQIGEKMTEKWRFRGKKNFWIC